VFHLGRLVEKGDAATIFVTPQHEITQAYITGRFG
jgi:phosphate transport system ATP-binding protein